MDKIGLSTDEVILKSLYISIHMMIFIHICVCILIHIYTQNTYVHT